MSIEVESPEVDITGKNIEVESTNRNVAIAEGTKDLEVTVNRREYSIVGDELYIPTRYEDAPQWLRDVIDTVTNTAISSAISDVSTLGDMLTGLIDELEVAKNTYTQSIISDNSIDERINTAITTLNSTLAESDSTILDIAMTRVTPEEASTIAIGILNASINGGAIGASINTLQTAIATVDSARATDYTALNVMIGDGLEDEATARANAVQYLNTYVGLDEAGNADGTGLLANMDIVQKQNDGVIETTTGTYDVMKGVDPDDLDSTDDDELLTDVEPYALWAPMTGSGSPVYNGEMLNRVYHDTSNNVYYLSDGNAWVVTTEAEYNLHKEWLRAAHVGDVYIKYAEGTESYKTYEKAYKFIKTVVDNSAPVFSTDTEGYTWALITDTDAQNAYVAALNAYDLANDKRRVFTDTPYGPYDKGDLWVDGSGVHNIVKTATKPRVSGYSADEWVVADEQTAEFADEINPKVVTLQNQVDGKIEYLYYDNPTNNPLSTISSGWGEAEHGNVVYYKDKDIAKGYWYNSTLDNFEALTDTSMLSALQKAEGAETLADGKLNTFYAWWSETNVEPSSSQYKFWLKTDGTMYYYESDSWITLESASKIVLDKGDLATVHKVFTDGTVDEFSYEYNGVSWQQLTPNGVVAGSSAVTNLDIALTSLDTSIYGESGLEQSLTGTIEDGLATVESKFRYGSDITIGEDTYRTGFGLEATGTLVDGETAIYKSKFKVSADDFVLEDPDTANTVTMNENGLVFARSNGVVYKYLQTIKTERGVPNSTPITLQDIYSTPQVLIAPATMPSYVSAYKEQDQTFVFDITNVSDLSDEAAHTYTFTPKAQLQLSEATFSDVLNGEFQDSSSNTEYSDSYYSTTNLEEFNASFTVQSIKGTGTANLYYYRNCTATLQSSSDNVNFTDLSAGNVTTFGATTGSKAGSVSYTGDIPVGKYIRIKFVYADAGGTFESGGATGYTDYQTINYTKTATTVRTSNSTTECEFSSYYYSPASTGQVRWYGSTSYYIGNSGISAEDIRDTYKPGYTITKMVMSARHVSGCSLGWNSTIFSSGNACSASNLGSSRTYEDDSYYDNVYYPVSYHSGNNPYCTATVTSAIDFTISCQKYISYSGSTATENSGSSFSITATASEATVLAEGTLDIVIIA